MQVPQAAPVRIKRLSLTDFRAFPGPAPTAFDLDGKNLLVYGENGAGKSSIFYALRDFFSLKPAKPLKAHKNVFSQQPENVCKVELEFVNDPSPVVWTVLKHPTVFNIATPVVDAYSYFFANTDTRVVDAALRMACLDYRALLDTNYKQGDGPVNLFAIAVDQLLRDYPVTVTGGASITIGQLWAKVQSSKPKAHTSAAIARISQACVEFNTAFRGALPALIPLVNELMYLLGWPDVELKALQTPGLTYNNARLKQNRAVDGQTLTPELSFRSHPLQTPQLFLNEARLSALGLAIYLAGRLACTPTASTDALKLLVLDDVLIGLDHSNRLPVLDLLQNKFPDWQIVLLTHDRNWFDLARSHLLEATWKCVEVFEGDSAAPAPMPIVRPTKNRPARALLDKAKELVQTPYVEAAANYARQAFEMGLRVACEVKGISMPYRVHPKTDRPPLQAQDFLDKLKKWSGSTMVPKADWDAALARLETMKNVVMNPYSHPNAPNIPKQEIQQSIDAVEKFLTLAGKN
jgi:ABC-type cobalamin/Fe3+-siderophores transport system ATPase subunit